MTQRQSQVKLLNIHQFAEICWTTPRTLRFYEQKGLFKPAKIDRWNGYRLYSPEQMRDFRKIKLLQNFGLSLEKTKETIKNDSPENFLDQELKRLEEDILEKQKELTFLKDVKKLMFTGSFEKILKTRMFGPFTLFCHRIENGDWDKINSYILDIWNTAIKLGLQCRKMELVFYIDPGYRPKGMPIEIALICTGKVNQSIALPPNHYFRKMAKTKILVCRYAGPYEYITLIYQKIHEHIINNQIRFEDYIFDLYKRGPLNRKSKYDFYTEICIPVS